MRALLFAALAGLCVATSDPLMLAAAVVFAAAGARELLHEHAVELLAMSGGDEPDVVVHVQAPLGADPNAVASAVARAIRDQGTVGRG